MSEQHHPDDARVQDDPPSPPPGDDTAFGDEWQPGNTGQRRGILRTILLTSIGFGLGTLFGYLFLPTLMDLWLDRPPEVTMLVVTATPSDPTAQTEADDTPADRPAPTATQTLMAFVLADARHFQGEPDAPVTIIEFSDFK